jgi:hypothetical protein
MATMEQRFLAHLARSLITSFFRNTWLYWSHEKEAGCERSVDSDIIYIAQTVARRMLLAPNCNSASHQAEVLSILRLFEKKWLMRCQVREPPAFSCSYWYPKARSFSEMDKRTQRPNQQDKLCNLRIPYVAWLRHIRPCHLRGLFESSTCCRRPGSRHCQGYDHSTNQRCVSLRCKRCTSCKRSAKRSAPLCGK